MRFLMTMLLLTMGVAFQNCQQKQFYTTDSSDRPAISDPIMVAQKIEGDLSYVCILDFEGKSVHLGFVDENLSNDINTPDAVCLSKEACENIVSEKFMVVGAEPRGFCPDRDPHVIALPDSEVRKLIDKI